MTPAGAFRPQPGGAGPGWPASVCGLRAVGPLGRGVRGRWKAGHEAGGPDVVGVVADLGHLTQAAETSGKLLPLAADGVVETDFITGGRPNRSGRAGARP